VVDLSVINSMQHPVWWPGAGVGNYLFPYTVVNPVNYFTGPFGPYWVNTHIMDAHTGTHLDPPAHFGPPPGFDFNSYDSWTKGVLKKFKSKYGNLGTTDVTSDKVPIHYFMGPARVVNVQHLVGTTDPNTWPAAPAIKVKHIKAHEKRYGSIKAGEVVIFQTGHTDAHFGPFKRGLPELTVKAPLDGQSEGWPAPTPDAVLYLAKKGVKHIAIDAPSMGSVRGEEAVMTHWAAANKGMIFTEYLIGVGQLPPTGAFFIFLNPKIENNHGGPGRAIAILP
jgi:kynurenine formamidase